MLLTLRSTRVLGLYLNCKSIRKSTIQYTVYSKWSCVCKKILLVLFFSVYLISTSMKLCIQCLTVPCNKLDYHNFHVKMLFFFSSYGLSISKKRQ